MTSREIREKFIEFFKNKGHKLMPSSSLIPNDPSVLFTTAGMQQFKDFYLKPELVEDKNIVAIQKCIRTGDIEEVGDDTHLTFFEMMGNFSFGGYGKKQAIKFAYEFITKEMGLKISYVTIFKGNDNVPRDDESEKVWKELGVKNIKEEGGDVFWGPTGDSGPCGSTTEIYCNDVEIWNIVFNEYFCDGSRNSLNKGEAKLEKLPVLGVDTGMGFERLVTAVNKVDSVYDTDLFNEEKGKDRIINDHIKAALFMISDGVIPSNTGSGYVLRKLIRRVCRYDSNLSEIINSIKEKYDGIYKLDDKGVIQEESDKFKETLDKGLKEFEKGEDPFILFTSYGFPIELTLELAKEKGIEVDLDAFNRKMKEHQEKSRTFSAGMFKGGLANHNENTIKLHTAHHLLLTALQNVVSPEIKQRGSNINENRLRIDFSFDRKLTAEEKSKVEELVNQKIKEGLDVVKKEMFLEEAKKIGAQMEFGIKYPSTVTVYFIGDFSKEFCGGPHVNNTSELGIFKIKKEESVARGIRRIKAELV